MIIENIKNLWEYLTNKAKGKQVLYEIIPNLYQSSEIRDSKKILISGINVVIDLAGGLDPEPLINGLIFYLYWPIKDIPALPNLIQLKQVSQFVYQCMMGAPPVNVLIHCRGGYNRASLVSGMVLSLMGMKGAEIVRLIREKRPGSLTNQTFVDFLIGM